MPSENGQLRFIPDLEAYGDQIADEVLSGQPVSPPADHLFDPDKMDPLVTVMILLSIRKVLNRVAARAAEKAADNARAE